MMKERFWAIIASDFTDKSTRKCRRRWYTYLNYDFKRGGWSPEEDTLLCEAQRFFGNRWTEIAKVVSCRKVHNEENKIFQKIPAQVRVFHKLDVSSDAYFHNQRDVRHMKITCKTMKLMTNDPTFYRTVYLIQMNVPWMERGDIKAFFKSCYESGNITAVF